MTIQKVVSGANAWNKTNHRQRHEKSYQNNKLELKTLKLAKEKKDKNEEKRI